MKEYKIAKGWAILIYVTAPLLIGLFGWLLIMPFIPGADDGISPTAYWFLAPISLGMIVFMIVGLIDTVKGKLVVDYDKVHTVSAFSNRQLRLDEIRGYRVAENYNFNEPNIESKKRIKVSTYLSRTDEIVGWLASSYPDLDLLNAEQEEQEILGNEELGWSVEQREEKLQKARKTAKTLNWIGGLVGAWTLFFAEPYEYAIIASIMVPIIAVVGLKLSAGLIRIDERKDSAYPSVAWAVLAPSLALCLRALLDFNIFSHSEVWAPSAIITFTFISVLLIGDKEFRFKKALDYFTFSVIAVMFYAYSYGAVVTVNCLNDRSEPEVYNAKVLSKRISSGKTTTYYVELTPWGLRKEVEEVSVSQDLFEQLDNNDEVNIYFMEGYLDIPWFIVTD